MYKKLLSICILSFSCQTSFADVKATLFGNIWNRDEFHRTTENYFAITHDQNNQWQTIKPFTDIPKNSGFIRSASANCSGKNCVSTAEFDGRPVLATSQNGGLNWTQIKYIQGIPTKLSYLDGSFEHAICYNEKCFATGLVKNTVGDDKAFSIIVSEDGGSSWFTPQIKNFKENKTPTMHDVNCIGEHCVARASDSDYQYYLMYSNDSGKNWETSDFTRPKLWLRDLKPAGNNFVAVGSYQKSQDDNRVDIVVVSRDYGKNWEIKIDERNPASKASIHSLSCNNKVCLAAGTQSNEYPFMMLSKDAGETWEVLKNANSIPHNSISVSINQTACSDKACAVIGTLHGGRDNFPFVATVDLINTKNQYAFTGLNLDPALEFNDIKCTDSACYIAGNDYHMDEYVDDAPIMLESDSKMMNWKDISDKSFKLIKGDHVILSAMAVSN